MAHSSNIAQYLDNQAAQNPTASALIAPTSGLSLDYSSLHMEVSLLARFFAEKGIRDGHAILLMQRPGFGLISTVFSLLRLGAVPVVIDPGMGLKSFLHCVERTKPDGLVGISQALWLARIFRKPFAHTALRIPPNLPKGWRLRAKAQEIVSDRAIPRQSDDLAALLFTSGSTGPAKGVCYTHGMFEKQIQLIRQSYHIQPGEVDFPLLPVFALFDPALGMCTVVPEMNAAKPAAFSAAKAVKALQEYRVTHSFGSPTLWSKIAQHCEHTGTRLTHLQRVLMAGAPAPLQLVKQMRTCLPHAKVHTPYGATEALPLTDVEADQLLKYADSPEWLTAGTLVGKPLQGVQMKVIREENGTPNNISECQECETGEIGEIVVRGAHVTQTYHHLPEVTSKAKISDASPLPESINQTQQHATAKWHRMGDLGYMDDSGQLFLCGRKAETIRLHDGKCFYPDCCEPVFQQHPDVKRAALIAYYQQDEPVPAIVIEPYPNRRPRRAKAQHQFQLELKKRAEAYDTTRPINHFFFHWPFPVDVRHNAKIHRLALAGIIHKNV